MAITGYSVILGNDKFNGAEGAGNSIAVNGLEPGTLNVHERNTSWNDFSFECNAADCLERSDNLVGAILFRYTNSTNYYSLVVDRNWEGLRCRVKKNNFTQKDATDQIIVSTPVASISSLSLEVVGSSIKLWVNGSLSGDVSDTSHSSGSICFGQGSSWEANTATWSDPAFSEISSARRRIFIM